MSAVVGRVVGVLAGLLALVGGGVAAEGLVIPVPSPLTSGAVTQIKGTLTAAKEKAGGRPDTVVFDFNPSDKDAATAEFGPCYDLARLISEQFDLKTVAYVHAKTTGHLVLPVLSCRELVTGPQAALGEAVAAGQAVGGAEAAAYAEFVGKARPAYVGLARKLFDPAVQLRKGKRAGADWFVDLRDKDKLAAQEVAVTNLTAVLPDGKVGLLTLKQLKDTGLSGQTVDGKPALLDALGLDPKALRGDPLAGRSPVAFRLTLGGKVDRGTQEMVDRQLKEIAKQQGNLLFVWLETRGGDLAAAREVADVLRQAAAPSDGQPMLVVGVVPETADDTAAVIALGCSEILVNSKREGGVFGDFEGILKQPGQNAAFLAASLRELAEAQGHPPLVVEGLVNRDLEVLRVHKKGTPSARRLVTRAEFDGNKDTLTLEADVKPKGQLLKLTANQAVDLGLARAALDTKDAAAVYTRYGVEPSKVKEATPAWVDRFANWLRLPAITFLLVVVGFTGLVLELKVPGSTVPGIVAALCFILVFWAHTSFSGQVAVLAGLLFVLGFVLILIEVFVLPGLGAAGVTGVLCMLGALGLVTVGGADGLPSTTADWLRVGGKVAQYTLALCGSGVLAFVVARFLPNIPYANKMVLPPPSEQSGDADLGVPGASEALALLGAVGTSVTVLRPAGTVQFGDGYVDVVTEGGFIPAGARVQVVEVEGNRVVVKEV